MMQYKRLKNYVIQDGNGNITRRSRNLSKDSLSSDEQYDHVMAMDVPVDDYLDRVVIGSVAIMIGPGKVFISAYDLNSDEKFEATELP